MSQENKQIDIVLSGQITSDDLFFPDGTVKYATPGGSCIWASIGAAFWSENVAVLSRCGTQTAVPAGPFREFGIDMSAVRYDPDEIGICDYIYYDEQMGKKKRGFKEGATSRDLMTPRFEDAPPGFFERTNGLMMSGALYPEVKSFADNVPEDLVLGLDTSLRWPGSERMNWDWLPLLAKIDCLLLSELELMGYFGIKSLDAVKEYIPLLRELCSGKTKIFCLKLGPIGVLVYLPREDAAWLLPAAPAKVLDATGCGDSFCGGFMVNYARNGDWFTAVAKGIVSASIIIEHSGSDFFSGFPKAEAERRLNQYLSGVRKEDCRIL